VYKICIHTCVRIHIYIYIHRPSWPLKASSVNQSSSCNNLLQTSYSGPFPKERKYKEIKQIPQTALSKFHCTYCSPHFKTTRICTHAFVYLGPKISANISGCNHYCIAYMYIYIYACMSVCACVCICVCICTCINVCVYVNINAYTYVYHIYKYTHTYILCTYIFKYIYMYICI